MYKLLLVDSDSASLDACKKFLEVEQFEVKTASHAQEGLAIIRQFHPDGIILEATLPDVNGFSACKKYRSITNVPILFYAESSTEDGKILAFELGADDYIEKKCSLRELTARIQANLRRSTIYNAPFSRSFGPLYIDLSAQKAFWMDQELSLAHRDFELLRILSEHPDQILTFQELCLELFGQSNDTNRQLLMMGISRLRQKLKPYPGLNDLIQTVRSKGYRFSPQP
ncbi:MAG: response regulator transcription factor [Lachnospiraceae bacterium]